MSPVKPLSLLIDEVIENEIDRWVEEKRREPEQEELNLEKEANG